MLMRESPTDPIVAISNGDTVRTFDPASGSGGGYIPRGFLQEQLIDTEEGWEVIDTTGRRLHFGDFNPAYSKFDYAAFKGLTDAAGNEIEVTDSKSDGRIKEMQRASTVNGTTVTESLLYDYLPDELSGTM